MEEKKETEKISTEGYEPEVIAFCCYYCAFAAADMAGSLRLNYPANVKIIRIPCTGKLDVIYILKAFENGADAVFVAGCLEGNCHYLEGNIRAKKRVMSLKKMLEEIGIEPERLEMFNMSSSMGFAFAEAAKEMTERARKLGRNPVFVKKDGDSSEKNIA
ncbi:MAG: hydrogenase iron-sulfur subunit [Candidatus Schekmanbacteria bacterium]|nr:hydrogenase iron-sulfur subunit [Candidatus Schekmanbacteria bacterium]